jgi:hypothetical protein
MRSRARCSTTLADFRDRARLEVEQRSGDYRVKLIVPETRADTLLGDEFTLGTMVGRFRACVDGFRAKLAETEPVWYD